MTPDEVAAMGSRAGDALATQLVDALTQRDQRETELCAALRQLTLQLDELGREIRDAISNASNAARRAAVGRLR